MNGMQGTAGTPEMREIATIVDGRDITRGYIEAMSYLVPQDRVLSQQAGYNYEVYEEILRDDQVQPALEQRRLAVIQHGIEVVPGGKKLRDKKAAEFIKKLLEHVGFEDIADKMLFGRFFGYSVAEALWARDGAHIIMDQVRVRDRRRFVFDHHFDLKMKTFEQPLGEMLPQHKFWTFAAGATHDDEPYDLGLAHYLFWPVWFKGNQTMYWLQFLERFGKPVIYGKSTGQASKQERDNLGKAVQAIMHGIGVVLNRDEAIEVVRHTVSGSGEYSPLYDRLNASISKVIIGQTMTLDDGSSRSQADVHLEVRGDLLRADARLVCGSFNRGPVRWLTAWNFPGAAYPMVRFEMDDTPDLNQLAERDDKIVSMTGRRPTPEYIERTYNIDLQDEAEAGPTLMPNPSTAPDDQRFAEGDGPFGLLAEQAREDIGPKIDARVARVAEALDDAGSLTALRDWLDHEAVSVLSVDSLSESLGQLLTVGFLTGWSDSADHSVAFAEDDAARLPFTEQIDFFRRKLNLTTDTWTDIWQSQHDVGFVVAGATRDSLISDLRTAVDSAIADGTTLEQFRKDFDDIVARHGWDHNGGRDWRSRVIYETNLRSSYAAGRYQQLKAVTDRRPYWRYRHSHASVQPREKHLAWDGLILRHDDPWWDAHYAPNGWGCGCYVESLSQRDLDRLGKTEPDTAPPVTHRQWTNKHTGQTHQVPDGIDPGWDYTPGKSSALGDAVRQRLVQSARQALSVAALGVADTLDHLRALPALTEIWRDWRRQDTVAGGEALEIGALNPAVVRALEDRDIHPATATVTVTRRDLAHTTRDSKRQRGQSLDDADLDRLPGIIAQPEAVLFDTQDPALLYVFNPVDPGRDKGKVVIRVNYAQHHRVGTEKRRVTTNAIRTAGYVARTDLAQSRYEVIEGGITVSKAAGTRRHPRCSTATILRWPPIYRDKGGLTDVNYPAYPAAYQQYSKREV